MPQAVEHHGRPASPGLAAGPLVFLDRPRADAPCRPATPPASGPTSKRPSPTRSTRSGRSPAEAGGDAADILEFQVAMLEDEALTAPAFDRIAAGIDAATAWTETLAAQIADYEAADDDYFRARAADLRDLRDQVVRRLSGEADIVLPDAAVLTGEDVTPTPLPLRRLEPRRRHRALRRQPVEPCRDAGPLARRADDRRPRRARPRRPRRRRSSTPIPAASSSRPATSTGRHTRPPAPRQPGAPGTRPRPRAARRAPATASRSR